MSYIENNLMNSERIVYKAKIHWFIYMPSMVVLFISLVAFASDPQAGPALGSFIFVFFIFLLIGAMITKITTELAITSKRVIAKQGLIRRNTVELNHSKVESFNIEQSILGRIFGFGTLIINGTGGGRTPIPNIDDPLKFRRYAMETIDTNQA